MQQQPNELESFRNKFAFSIRHIIYFECYNYAGEQKRNTIENHKETDGYAYEVRWTCHHEIQTMNLSNQEIFQRLSLRDVYLDDLGWCVLICLRFLQSCHAYVMDWKRWRITFVIHSFENSHDVYLAVSPCWPAALIANTFGCTWARTS